MERLLKGFSLLLVNKASSHEVMPDYARFRLKPLIWLCTFCIVATLVLAIGVGEGKSWTTSTASVAVFPGADGATGWSVTVDATGNVYTVGYFEGTVDFDPGPGVSFLTSVGGEDVFVSKLDNDGNLIWAKSFGGAGNEGAFDVAVDSAGSVYTVGYFSGTADFDPGPGTSTLTSAAFNDAFVSKLDSNGNFLWANRFGGSAFDAANAVAVDAGGNVVVTGLYRNTASFDLWPGTTTLTSVGSDDVFVLKLDPNGNLVWLRSFGGESTDFGNAVAVDVTGNIYTAGEFGSTADFDPGVGNFNLSSKGNRDAFVSKLDANGNFVWARAFGDGLADTVNAVAVDGSGNVLIAGSFQGTVDFEPWAAHPSLTAAGALHAFVAKFGPQGSLVWAKSFGGSTGTTARSVAVDSLGNVYTGGNFNGTTDFDPGSGVTDLTAVANHDAFVSKLDADGNFVWARSFGGNSVASVEGIGADTIGNVFAGGYFFGTVDFDPGSGITNLTSAGSSDPFLVKLGSDGVTNPTTTTTTTTTTVPVVGGPTGGGGSSSPSGAPTPTPGTQSPTPGASTTDFPSERVAGSDRYSTSVEISRENFSPEVPVVYLAIGTNYADALSAGAAAGGAGPVLLTQHHRLPEATRDELDRLRPRRIVVLGGVAAISNDVLNAARPFAAESTTRIGGANRYETATQVSAATFTTNVETLYIATGTNYADALSAGGAAAGRSPVLLVERNNIPQVVATELARLRPRRIVILGGTSVVSTALQTALADYTSGSVTRIGGTNRFETSADLSRATFSPGAPVVYVATGVNFADALSAAALGAPVLLTRSNCLPASIKNELERLDADRIVVLGGISALSDDVRRLMACSR